VALIGFTRLTAWSDCALLPLGSRDRIRRRGSARSVPTHPHVSCIAVRIAWSRIFVGTYYLTDVLGGAFTGSASAVLVRASHGEGSRLDRLVAAIL